MTGESWSVLITAPAAADLQEILHWTLLQFGNRQAHVYAETLISAIEALESGPAISGVKDRAEIAKGLFTLHVARKGRKGRHFVLFRIASGSPGRQLEVLRLLHDATDLRRQLVRVAEDL
jgi:toxin ParE1/3/4